jgi:hypothetical protein
MYGYRDQKVRRSAIPELRTTHSNANVCSGSLRSDLLETFSAVLTQRGLVCTGRDHDALGYACSVALNTPDQARAGDNPATQIAWQSAKAAAPTDSVGR